MGVVHTLSLTEEEQEVSDVIEQRRTLDVNGVAEMFDVGPYAVWQWVRRGYITPTSGEGMTQEFDRDQTIRFGLQTGRLIEKDGAYKPRKLGSTRKPPGRAVVAELGLTDPVIRADLAALFGVAANAIQLWSRTQYDLLPPPDREEGGVVAWERTTLEEFGVEAGIFRRAETGVERVPDATWKTVVEWGLRTGRLTQSAGGEITRSRRRGGGGAPRKPRS
jgi:hypothetical protein